MKKTIGVAVKAQGRDLFSFEKLKHLLLAFDSLAVCTVNGSYNPPLPEGENPNDISQLIEWLEENKILSWGGNPNNLPPEEIRSYTEKLEADPEASSLSSYYTIAGVLQDKKEGVKHGYFAYPQGPYDPLWHNLVRQTALRISKYEKVDATPITFNDPLLLVDTQTAKYDDVINLVIQNLPMPGEGTSIEEIMDFRQSLDAKTSLLNLRLWAREVARSEVSLKEADDKLEHLLNEYRSYMKLHFRSIYPGAFETLVVGGAGIVEDVIKLNVTSLVKRTFSLKHRKTKLLLAEKEAPGRELSYIVKARDRFT